MNLLLEFLLQTLEPFGGFGNGPDVFLEDDLLRRCGADAFREPAHVGRVPIGPAHVTDIWPEQAGLETELGVFEVADGIFPCPGEIADGVVFDVGDLDGREVTGAGQTGQLHGVPAVGFHPVARLFGEQRWCHHPTVVPLLGHISVEPGATGPGFIDADELFGFGLPLADHLIDVSLTGTHGAKGEPCSTVIVSHIGDGNRVFVDIHTNDECVRLGHG